MSEALGLGVTLWSPLGGGLLTGKYRHSSRGRLSDWKRLVHTESSEQKTAVVDTVIAIAEEVGRTPAQVATAWVNEHSRRLRTASVPIIGPRTMAQLGDYLGALDLELSVEQYDRLSQVSTASLGIPHEANAASLDAVQGGAAAATDGPVVPVA